MYFLIFFLNSRVHKFVFENSQPLDSICELSQKTIFENSFEDGFVMICLFLYRYCLF